jgi:hypothetical protein
MSEELIERENIRFDNELMTFELPEDDYVMNGGVHFKLGLYKTVFVIATPDGYEEEMWNGRVFWERKNTPIVIEMLSDVVAGKLIEPEKSRFEYKDDGFIYKDEKDNFFIGAQTVWTMPQREAPTQVFIYNFREHRYGALGKQGGMRLHFTPNQARGMLSKLEELVAEGKI